MTTIKIEKTIKILLFLAPCLALIFIKGFYFPFIITRTLYFRLLIELALSLYFLLLAMDFKKYRPKLNLTFILLGVFLVINVIAAIFGLDFYKSWWSNFERMEGVIGLIYLAVYLFLLVTVFKAKRDWLINIRVILAASLLVSLYGLAQRFSLLPVFEAGVDRISSTIGNAAFLAGFLLLAIGLGAYYYTVEENKKYRYFGLLVMAIDLVVLLLTSTRGAILGLLIGILAWSILTAIFGRGKLRKYSSIILAIFIVTGIGFFFSRQFLANSPVEPLRRLATISFNDPTVSNRLAVWRMALDNFKERPWLGVGLENFNLVYNKYFTPKITEDWFDRTHNVYLDQLATNGLIGLAAYLAIFVYLFVLLFRKRREDLPQFTILSSLFLAYGIHNFFVFDTINTSLVYFFLIGFLSFKEPVTNGVSQAEIDPAGKVNNKLVNFFVVLLIIANLYAFYYLIYRPLKINRSLYIGYYYTLADPDRSYENFKTALSYRFGSEESALQLNNSYDTLESDSITNQSDLKKFYNLTKEKSEFADSNFPLDIMVKLRLGQLLINNYQSDNDLKEAETLLKACLDLSPGRPEAYYLLYNLYSKQKDLTQAEIVIRQLTDRLPWLGDAKIVLADIVYQTDPRQAEQLFNQGINEFHTSKDNILEKIIEYLLNAKRYQETIPYYLQLITDVPERYDYRIDLSKVYYLSSQIDKAIEQINIINSKSPQTLKGNESYLNLLFQTYNK